MSEFQNSKSATFQHNLMFCLMVEVSCFPSTKRFSLVEAARGELPPLTASTPDSFLKKADTVYQALRNLPNFLHCLFSKETDQQHFISSP